jgi:YVTN family beta-propeller protein
MRRGALAALVLGIGCGTAGADEEPRRPISWPGMTRTGAVLLPNGWSLRPAGKQTVLGDFPVLMAEHPSAPILAVLHAGYGTHEVITLDTQASPPRIIARVVVPETYTGLAWSPDGSRLFVGGGFDQVIYRFDHADGLLSHRVSIADQGGDAGGDPRARSGQAEPLPRHERGSKRAQGCVAGLALSRDGRTLWAADAFGHTLARFDDAGKLGAEIALEEDSYPYGLALDEAKGRLYASLWNRAAVAVVDTSTGKVVGRWPTQEHPNEMLLARGGKILYVANANRNTVSVIDTESGRPVETIGTAIDPRAPSGSTPNSLSLSPDETMLFVANANTNDIAVVNVAEPGASSPLGFIPVGWYPTSVRVSRDGKTLYVANGKGTSSKSNRGGPNPLVRGDNTTREYIAGLFRGTLSTLAMPGPRQMAGYSKTVYECSPLQKGDPTAVTGAAPEAGNPIPRQVGDPSPITHCVYIIKENRTYDQVFGDLPEGNGEPQICLFPGRVTPNHHALAREFVLLDNFYVESEVSADGHEWSMGAYATDFVERTWPLGYRGDKRVTYVSEGNFAIARPAGGYLWDRAAAKGVSYRSYGEFVQNGKTRDDPATAKVEALRGHFDPKFRSFDMDYLDQKRADRFLEELAEFEAKGEMPRLIILRLPNDHTAGTTPGKPSPTAHVADNDLALGRVVEGLSRSTFWPHLAIFVVEDDAQNGPDHVDAHRTVALSISPYTRRKTVDSTLYSTSSMLRTIELCLGLEPMSQFDAAARPMFAAFTPRPDLSPYAHRPVPAELMQERNQLTAWGAAASQRLDLEIEDRADDMVFNEIIWKSVKGPDSPMPPPVRAAFVLPAQKLHRTEDLERDED